MANSGIWTHYFWLINCADTPHMCITQDTNDSFDSLRVVGKIRKRKKTTTELNISLSKIFLTEKFFLLNGVINH